MDQQGKQARRMGAPPWRRAATLLAAGALLLAGMHVRPATASGTALVEGDLYYTRYCTTPRVNKVPFSYDGTTFTLGAHVAVANTNGADGLIFAPDGDLLVGGQGDAVHKVNPTTGTVVTRSAGGTASFHLSMDASGTKAWSAGIPGALAEIPLTPFSNGIYRALHGSDTAVTSLAFDGHGGAYYTSSGSGGFGSVGRIDMATFTTTRVLSGVAAAHGMAYDSYTGDLMLFGDSHITQIDPATMTIIASRAFSNVTFDQGTVDGHGHMYVADNGGKLLFMDYSASHMVDAATNFTFLQFLDGCLDDVAPLAGFGAPVHDIHLSIAGGNTLPVGSTATVTVSAVDIGGTGVPGVPITLHVTGANPGTFTGTTDTSGQVQFSYTGNTAGDDTLVADGGGVTSGATAIHWFACTAAPSVGWKPPLSSTTPYDMPAGSQLDIKFAYGDCSHFIHDESVVLQIVDTANPDYPVTTWVYGYDVLIDDAAGEYQERFDSSWYGLSAGQNLMVQVVIGGNLVGEAPIHVVP